MMSCSTVEDVEMVVVDDGNNNRGVFPEWIGNFLEQPFFDKCPRHDLHKSESNRYCVTCNKAICRYCITSNGHHNNHRILTIYRHVYQDVVPLSELESLVDCSKIQPYKCNKKWVVSLTPLPHNGSGSLNGGGGACAVCKRKLTDPDRFRFCSIACKVQQASNEIVIPGRVWNLQRRISIAQLGSLRDPRRRSRKGFPCRAPFS